MPLPSARGPLSELVLAAITDRGPTSAVLTGARAAAWADPLRDDDFQLTLTVLYELHLQGLAGVNDDLEWNVDLLGARAVLEGHFERALRQLVKTPHVTPHTVPQALIAMTSADGGPGLSRYLARDATLAQWQEFLTHRAVYHLREADLHTFGIPRLAGTPKAALVEVQSDEYGGGRPERMHSALFARTLRAVGLDDTYGHYIDVVPALTLASLNTMSLFGLHRRHLGALVGHLCGVEMTSSGPNRLYGNGLRRLGFDRQATLFFDEHVEADAVHEQIVCRDLAGGLAIQQPERARDVVFGAAVCLAVDALGGERMMASWAAGRSSLHPGAHGGVAATTR